MEQDYLSLAIQQILWEFKLDSAFLENKLKKTFQYYGNHGSYPMIKYLIEKELNNQDFEWQYFNDCVKICRENKIIPTNYHFLLKYPEVPKNVPDFLNQLTIPEIKQIAKSKGITGLPTRKAEIIEKMVKNLKPIDFKDDVKNFLQKEMANYKQKLIREKSKLLIDSINTRYYALSHKDRMGLNVYVSKYYIPELTYSDEPDDWILMEKCIAAYPKPDPQTGMYHQLPPYFLGDTAYIEYRHDAQREQQAERIIRQQQRIEQRQKEKAILKEQQNKMGCLDYVLLCIAIFWLAGAVIVLQTTHGMERLYGITFFAAPFIVYWFWRSRYSKEARIKRYYMNQKEQDNNNE